MSTKFESMTRTLQEKRVTGSAGGDMVRVEMDGLAQVTRVSIDESLMSGGDREMLETLIVAATNQASAKAKELHLEVMGELTGGIDLSGLAQLMPTPPLEDPPPSDPR